MGVAIYARVSTVDQNIRQQVKYIRKYCTSKGYKVLKSYEDKESGTLFSRKAFQALLRHTKEGKYDRVVILDVNRLTRDYYDGIKIERHFRSIWGSCPLESVSEPIDLGSASGRMMFRIKLVVSCYDVENMKEKQRIGIDRARRENKYHGRPKGARDRKKRKSRK